MSLRLRPPSPSHMISWFCKVRVGSNKKQTGIWHKNPSWTSLEIGLIPAKDLVWGWQDGGHQLAEEEEAQVLWSPLSGSRSAWGTKMFAINPWKARTDTKARVSYMGSIRWKSRVGSWPWIWVQRERQAGSRCRGAKEAVRGERQGTKVVQAWELGLEFTEGGFVSFPSFTFSPFTTYSILIPALHSQIGRVGLKLDLITSAEGMHFSGYHLPSWVLMSAPVKEKIKAILPSHLGLGPRSFGL